MGDPLVGRKIGQYEITSLLGQGGMAAVYKAHQVAMKRDVAMKVVSQLLTQDSSFLARFNREVEFIASLEHAHIIPVHDHGTTEDGITFLTMRYLKGGTLAERIHAGKPIPLGEANRIMSQVADALDYAHRRGIIHRDIKPSNVLLDEQGEAFLADFGLARVVEPGSQQKVTQESTLVGTPTYISPEQIQQLVTDERSDLYSLGVVLYEMLAGRPPFTSDSAFTTMRAHIEELPPPIRKFRRDLPETVERFMSKALSKDPADRYQTASEMAIAFSKAIHDDGATQALNRKGLPQLTRYVSIKESKVLAGAAIAIALLLIGGVYFATRDVKPSIVVATVAPTFDEATRPEKGIPDDLQLSDTELRTARATLQDSFIGMVACALTTDYHASLARSVRIRAQELKLPVRVEDSQADKTQQPIIINRFVAQGAKALVVCELDTDSVNPALNDAIQAGVKVVRLSEVVDRKNTVTLTFTNDAMGQAVGNFAGDMIKNEMNGQANVAILDYPPVPVIKMRADAMEKALLAKVPDAKIVGRFEGGLADNGEKSMTDALKQFPDINVIMSINDAGAYGAIKALEKAGKKPNDVKIVSVDAENEARRMINQGYFFVASVDSGAVQSGQLAVDAAVKLLADSPVPRQIMIPGKVVTRDVTATAAATVSGAVMAEATAAP